MSKIWFTSDTHFSSERTLELSKRPFRSVEEMDKILIENWNSVVGENDTVYHLGDFGNYEIIKQLNGSINLIKGNYDKNDEENLKQYEKYFNLIFNNTHNIILKTWQEDCFVCYNINMGHEPSKVWGFNIDETNINLFGHIHKLCMIKLYGLNVGVDCHNFYPIDLETVLFYHNAILNHYDIEVFE